MIANYEHFFKFPKNHTVLNHLRELDDYEIHKVDSKTLNIENVLIQLKMTDEKNASLIISWNFEVSSYEYFRIFKVMKQKLKLISRTRSLALLYIL